MTQADAPVRWEPCDAILTDGTTVRIRGITPADSAELVEMHGRLSDETVYLRFFSYHPRLSPREVTHFTTVDGENRMALVATLRGRIVGVARYDRGDQNPEEAEVAFLVEDAHQGRGLGTLLLEHLAAYARTRGITRFIADTLPQNAPMQDVFHQAGFVEESRFNEGLVRVRLEIEPTEATLEAIEQRWAHASARSLGWVLRPRSVAVIGCGRDPGHIGHEILRNILASRFQGPVFPVNRSARAVASVPAYPSVTAVPADVDLAVIAVPQPEVAGVVEECAAKGVRGLVIISAGYAEVGASGAAAQTQLVESARAAGMRIVGPNCMGILNTAPDVSLNATFAPVAPRPGRVALSSQSGGLGIAVLEEARRRGLGISSFVSVGNKADISGNDLLQYWDLDDTTDVILLYLESFGNPRRFARVARRVSRTKPIVAVKAGRSGSGSRAASSHTAALASPDTAVDALFRQTGVIRVDTLEEMFDVAQVLTGQPRPAGRRLAIVGNAGGPGILAADAAEAAGLTVPELAAGVQDQLRGFLPSEAGVRNPVDMVASASASDYEKALGIVLADGDVDAVLAIFVPTLLTRGADVAEAMAAAARGASKPVVTAFVGDLQDALPAPGGVPLPAFAFPESAARALARACEYGEWRSRAPGHLLDPSGLRPLEARKIVQAVLAREEKPGWLGPAEAGAVLAAYGIETVATVPVTDAAGAVAAARRLGWPVVLKGTGPGLVHRTDAGAVTLAIATPDEMEDAFSAMATRLGKAMTGAVVQPMAEAGIETIIGVIQDRSFGPLVMFGSGGTEVELFGDRAFRAPPLTDVDAAELVRAPKGSARLFGYRGSPPVDTAGVERTLMRVGRLAQDLPEIIEMDLNPAIVTAKGVVVVDAKMRVERPWPQPDPSLRRLS